MTKLALEGGRPVRTKPFPAYVTTGQEEQRAVARVLRTGVLSKFLGTWSKDFYGGPEVQALEKEWARYFKVKHAVSMNSATSGLYAAVAATGIGPGDEVIVSPYTMSASVTGVPLYGGVPVFADIDERTFCLAPDSIRAKVTSRTKAIIAVDLFGHPAAMKEIMEIAEEHDLAVIEDAAQAPGAKLSARLAGTLGHIGVFSLNYHKTIQTGEGCLVVTDDETIAEKLQLVRNHAEAVVEGKGVKDLTNMLGFNYRMTELEAAIARCQLKKLERLVKSRIACAGRLTKGLDGISGITPPFVAPGVRHGYYMYAMRFDAEAGGMSRERLVNALSAEGIPIFPGYVKPLYLQPLYQRRAHWALRSPAAKRASYEPGACPVTERMHFSELIATNVCHANTRPGDLDDVVEAFQKVLS